MKRLYVFALGFALTAQSFPALAEQPAADAAKPAATPASGIQGQKEDEDLPGIGDAAGASKGQQAAISDPIEPVNRAFFVFNDKLYYWALKPVATGYNKVLPQSMRRGVKNFFSNLRTPVRLVNCALQGEFSGAWSELERLVINTVVGVAGFGDPAKNWWSIEKHEADLGQTFGRYGMGTSIYFVCPFLGPLNVRDGVGYTGDVFLDPITYVFWDYWYWDLSVKAYDTVNTTSLHTGEYEDFKKASLDPYVAMRDAYAQYRDHLVKTARGDTDGKDSSVKPAAPLRAD